MIRQWAWNLACEQVEEQVQFKWRLPATYTLRRSIGWSIGAYISSMRDGMGL